MNGKDRTGGGDEPLSDVEGDDGTSACGHVEPSTSETAEYLTNILPELARMAERSGLDVAAYLLKVAQLEAKERLGEERSPRS